MDHSKVLICPKCNQNGFVIKYEASHVYSYVVDSDAPGEKNNDEFLSFLYDKRELTDSSQYAECLSCGTKFPCSFNVWDKNTSLMELQSVIDNYKQSVIDNYNNK